MILPCQRDQPGPSATPHASRRLPLRSPEPVHSTLLPPSVEVVVAMVACGEDTSFAYSGGPHPSELVRLKDPRSVSSSRWWTGAAPRRRAARRGAPPPYQPGTCGGRSLDQFIRPPQQRRRDREAEGLGGLEVDDQLELRRLFDGEVGGPRALQDFVDVDCGAPI